MVRERLNGLSVVNSVGNTPSHFEGVPHISSSSDDAQFGDSSEEEEKSNLLESVITASVGVQPQEEAKVSARGD